MVNRRVVLVFVVLALLGVPVGGTRAVNVGHDAVVSGNPVDWTPHVLDGRVKAILPLGDRVFVGGSFTQVREEGKSQILTRNRLFAFNARTGVIDASFVPDLDGEVETVVGAPDATALFVGGEFGMVSGVPASKLVKLDAATGAIRSEFSVSVTSRVKDMVLRGNRLFLAGNFTEVDHESRLGLAAVDAETGALDPSLTLSFTDPLRGASSRVEAIDATPDGSTLVAIGNFTRVDGQDRHQIALVDVAARPARLQDWHTNRYNPGPDKCSSAFDTHMRDVDFSPDGAWFVVVTTGAYSRGTLCDTAARWETAALGVNLQPTWVDHSGGDSFTGVAITGAAVYVNGHMRWLNNPFPQSTGIEGAPGPGNVPREGIAALDPASGLPLPWDPGRERGEGGYAFTATPDGLWTGSDTARIGGEQHGRIAFLPLAGGFAVPPATTAGLPGDLYSLGLDGSITRRWFDGGRTGAASQLSSPVDWSRMRGAFAVNGRLYTGRDDGSLEVRGFDGAQFGEATPVDLRGLTSSHFPIAKVTGMFYDNGRLYYGVSGGRNLSYRYFTPVGDIIGAETVLVPEDSGMDWGAVKGMTLAAGRLYYVLGDDLHAVEFVDGRPRPGTDSIVAQGSAASSWASRGLFVLPPSSPPPA